MQTLYHITKKENLISILIDATFKTSYSREIVIGEYKKTVFGAPMVSFCNLPPSKLKTIMGSYGKFGIGLTKEWADRQEVKEVKYVHKQCESIVNLLNWLDENYVRVINEGTFEKHNEYNKKHNKLRYIKNIHGERWNYENPIPYCFAKENEWRFVPNISADIPAFLSIKEICTSCQKAWYNKYANKIELSFQPGDVECIIVENKSDTNDLIRCLQFITEKTKVSCWDILSKRIYTYADLS